MPIAWLRSKLQRNRPPLVVPRKFNRNSKTVTSLMPPEESGVWLLERMRQHIGLETYANRKILDFGCGVRFAQAILNTGYEIGSYTGVDIDRKMIAFLQKKVRDPRFSYHSLDLHNPLYNKRGRAMSLDTTLPVPHGAFDVVSMFSVITHQYPADASTIFTILRRHVAPDGSLFFTCFLDPAIESFEDRSAQRNGGWCSYNPAFLTGLFESAGWRAVKSAPGEGPLIADSFVCRPA